MRYMDRVEFSELVGKTLTKIVVEKENYRNFIDFYCSDGSIYKMLHEQDCCEGVWIEDICGDIQELVGAQILLAEHRCEHGERTADGETSTWTFFILRTLNHTVTIRWYGESNGYYSEDADFYRVTTPN